MSFQRESNGTMLGCGPDADYPGRAECEAHWAKIRAAFPERPVELHPMPSLAEQARKQIARLKREVAEWEEIASRAALAERT